MIEKRYDVFIAYHGSYSALGSLGVAEKIYDFFVKKGLKPFLFTKSGNDTYKQNIISAMQSKTFLLIANSNLKTDENGKINHNEHYELSTEIDAFYSLTQLGNDCSVSDSKILSYGIRRGEESKLHELFANRTHLFYDEDEEIESFELVYNWLINRLNKYEIKQENSWSSAKKSGESIELYSERTVVLKEKNLSELVSKAKEIKCLGISNNELTSRIDQSALIDCLNNGGKIQILFLDPNGVYTKLREEEEQLSNNRIKRNTELNIDTMTMLKEKLPQETQELLVLKTYDYQPRMNILIIDDLVLLQYYANFLSGYKNPTFVVSRSDKSSTMYDFCESIFDDMLKKSKDLN